MPTLYEFDNPSLGEPEPMDARTLHDADPERIETLGWGPCDQPRRLLPGPGDDGHLWSAVTGRHISPNDFSDALLMAHRRRTLNAERAGRLLAFGGGIVRLLGWFVTVAIWLALIAVAFVVYEFWDVAKPWFLGIVAIGGLCLLARDLALSDKLRSAAAWARRTLSKSPNRRFRAPIPMHDLSAEQLRAMASDPTEPAEFRDAAEHELSSR